MAQQARESMAAKDDVFLDCGENREWRRSKVPHGTKLFNPILACCTTLFRKLNDPEVDPRDIAKRFLSL